MAKNAWEQLDSLRLQRCDAPQGQLSIGGFWFPPDEGYCLVARLYSDDDVFIGPEAFRIVDSVHLGMEPLKAIASRAEASTPRTGRRLRWFVANARPEQ